MGRAAQVQAEEFDELEPDQIKDLRELLLSTRDNLLARNRRRIGEALEEELRLPDDVDQASTESDQAFQLRLANKDRKLLSLIEHALVKMDTGEYGYCEGTGDPIPIARLRLRPWARYSVEYKQKLEKERALHVRPDQG